MKVLLGIFNQEKALVGAFSMIVKPMDRLQHYSIQCHLTRTHAETKLRPQQSGPGQLQRR